MTNLSEKNRYPVLEKALGYQFKDKGLLELALTHRSKQSKNNERLEFLGDALLGFAIAARLFQDYPQLAEGKLSRCRASLVKGETLAGISRQLDIGNFLLLGSGELKSAGWRRDSTRADALEAIIGAVYLDGGTQAAIDFVYRHFNEKLQNLVVSQDYKDPKTKLQEYLQAKQLPLPEYQLIETVGEEHDCTFHVSCIIGLIDTPVIASGSSRRKAEQAAAKKVLQQLNSKESVANSNSSEKKS